MDTDNKTESLDLEDKKLVQLSNDCLEAAIDEVTDLVRRYYVEGMVPLEFAKQLGSNPLDVLIATQTLLEQENKDAFHLFRNSLVFNEVQKTTPTMPI